MIISKYPSLLGGFGAIETATRALQGLQGRRLAENARIFSTRSFLAGAGISCLSLLCTFVSLPAMSEEVKLLNVSYDPTRERYTDINDLFSESYKARSGVTVTFEQSHGGSSKQARSVIDGLKADVVTLGAAWDITAIEHAGLIKPGWQEKLPYNSCPYTSTVGFLVRKGNPKNIKDWKDLTARWAFLAVWGATAQAKTHDLREAQAAAQEARDFPVYQSAEARAVIEKFYNNNVPVLNTGARGATVTFAQKQLGDVLLNWENELWLALDEFGKDKFETSTPRAAFSASRQSPSSTKSWTKKAREKSPKPIEIPIHLRSTGNHGAIAL